MSKNINNINKSLNNRFATKEEVNAKANQTSVDSLQTNVNNLQTSINSKVNQSDYNSKMSELEGKINEAFQNANNGKNLIATAIGAPLSGNDTFSAMSDKINGLTNDFKDALSNSGVEISDTDKLQDLIAKIEEAGNSESQMQTLTGQIIPAFVYKRMTLTLTAYEMGEQIADSQIIEEDIPCFTVPLSLEPTTIMAEIETTMTSEPDAETGYSLTAVFSQEYYYNIAVSNLLTSTTTVSVAGSDTINYIVTSELYREGQTLFLPYILGVELGEEDPQEIFNNITRNYYIITGGGAGEDNALRNFVASLLTDKGVYVTQQDDLASLLNKVDTRLTTNFPRIINSTSIPTSPERDALYLVSPMTGTLTETSRMSSISSLKGGEMFLRNLNISRMVQNSLLDLESYSSPVYTLGQEYSLVGLITSKPLISYSVGLQYYQGGFSPISVIYSDSSSTITTAESKSIVFCNGIPAADDEDFTISSDGGDYTLSPYLSAQYTLSSADMTSKGISFKFPRVNLTDYTKLVVMMEYETFDYVKSGSTRREASIAIEHSGTDTSNTSTITTLNTDNIELSEQVYDITNITGDSTIEFRCKTYGAGTARLVVYYAYLV